MAKLSLPPLSRDLTKDELEILKLVAQEKTNLQIADSFEEDRSEDWVKTRLRDLFKLLGVKTRTGLALQAVKRKIIKL